MKRSLCLIMAIVVLLIAVLTSSAFTVQSSRVYRSADSSGAYVVSFNDSHVDITRYTADQRRTEPVLYCQRRLRVSWKDRCVL